jgi:hypothetical protein
VEISPYSPAFVSHSESGYVCGISYIFSFPLATLISWPITMAARSKA